MSDDFTPEVGRAVDRANDRRKVDAFQGGHQGVRRRIGGVGLPEVHDGAVAAVRGRLAARLVHYRHYAPAVLSRRLWINIRCMHPFRGSWLSLAQLGEGPVRQPMGNSVSIAARPARRNSTDVICAKDFLEFAISHAARRPNSEDK